MATMTAEQEKACAKDFSDRVHADLEAHGLTKADLLAAIDASDTWMDNNQASYKSALPEPAATTLTNSQKVKLFMVVAYHRYLAGI